MKRSIKQQRGTSLIELLISIGIGLSLLTAICAYFYGSVGAQKNTLREISLGKEMRFAENLMISELRRSGFAPVELAAPDLNALTPGIFSTSCILSNYYNNNGATSILNVSGFRFINNQIQMRNNPAGKCSDEAGSNNWESLIDGTRIKVTSFSISQYPNSAGTLNLSYEAEAKNEHSDAALSNLDSTKIKVNNLAVDMFNVSVINTLTAAD
ncbi:hypothetical protein ABHF33_09485 [Chitinibacter sp. FCG-7]|uniref:Prepilin-type N-terminal cleavage/methylation domain-containing protein n=1 Tax=Chitinibacter mangrovi TaxID=3153927 RepID=A0AAU7F647_9NEIS